MISLFVALGIATAKASATIIAKPVRISVPFVIEGDLGYRYSVTPYGLIVEFD